MSNVNKYLKIAKDAVIEPAENIEDKIIDRISHIGEKDKELLDDNYQEFFKKTNSRVYQFNEKIRNNPGAVAGLAVTISLILFFIKIIFSSILLIPVSIISMPSILSADADTKLLPAGSGLFSRMCLPTPKIFSTTIIP